MSVKLSVVASASPVKKLASCSPPVKALIAFELLSGLFCSIADRVPVLANVVTAVVPESVIVVGFLTKMNCALCELTIDSINGKTRIRLRLDSP